MPTVYRADHCGSLIRPDELKAVRADWVRGKTSLDALREAEDKAIIGVLAMQRDAGLSLEKLTVDGGATVNDGLLQFQADLLGVPVRLWML